MQNSKRKNKPGRPALGQSLSPEQVAEAALRLIDSEGIDAFSMRRLGQELGVEAMALYNHYEDKDAILDAVASLILARVPLPPEKGSWKTRFKTLCAGVRSAARQNPNLFRVAMTRPLPPAAGLPIVESALSSLADAGLNTEAQTSAYHTSWLYVRSFCLWEIEEFTVKPDPAALATMATSYPHAASAMKLIFSSDAERQFDRGLDLILRGLTK